MPLDILHEVSPHDCPSIRALGAERLGARRIGQVRGAAFHDTAIWRKPA